MHILNDRRADPILWFIYGALITTAMCIGIFTATQQSYRQTANDPQIQMAEDAAAVLSAGGNPADVVPRAPLVDLTASLAPWIAVYDSSGAVLEASGQLDNAPPKLPQGVFDTSTWRAWIIGHHLNFAPANENRFSWQPNPDVRQAVIIVQTKDGRFVAAGRSMRMVENRILQLTFNMLLGWAVTIGALFVLSFILWIVRR
jgi:hypothetical protein